MIGLPSVMMPSVPSAPMNSFVVSNPADDFLALLRVFMTSPLGRTTVYEKASQETGSQGKDIDSYQVKKPFSLGSTISDSICCKGE